MITVESTEGETRTFDFTLTKDGTAFSLSGIESSLRLELTTRLGATSVITSGVAVVSASAGTVSYTPADGTILTAANSPYKFRFRVDDATSKRHYFPNQGANLWKVNKP